MVGTLIEAGVVKNPRDGVKILLKWRVNQKAYSSNHRQCKAVEKIEAPWKAR